MDSNKENIDRVKNTTRIPLPMNPLPALPTHLLNNKPSENVTVRRPLKTLMQSNSVPSSSQDVVTKPKRKASLKLDTRHVTVRPKGEQLDWSHKVLKENDSIIYISDDDEDVSEKNINGVNYFNDKGEKNCLGDCRLAATPALEHKSVRNIKRSLKRPSSRELIGLSPVPKHRDEKVKRKLNFNEKLQERLQSPDTLKRLYMICAQEYSDDMFIYLLSVERKPLGIPNASSITRACVINWLMKVNGPDGNPAVIQTACWYLDSILGTGHVPLAKLQLVATACYWIAQKIHGPVLSASKLVKYSNHAFTAEHLRDAEKAVVERLKFPHQPVVPQEFITYLAWWCDNNHPGEIEVAATFLCMSGLLVNKVLCEEYPSVIAVASIRNALLLLGKKELIYKLQSNFIYKEALKKSLNISVVSSILRRAVRAIWAPLYEYKAPLEHYSLPPNFIAQRIITAASELSVLDIRHVKRRDSVSFK